MVQDGVRSVPFYSRIVNWHGEDSGFPTAGDVNEWQRNPCGIAWLRMVLDYFHCCDASPKPTCWELLRMGLERRAYNEKGWIHQGLLDLAGIFGISGRCLRQKGVSDLAEATSRRSICIASVTVGFPGGQVDESGQVRVKGGYPVVA
jgi:hypothetical protein